MISAKTLIQQVLERPYFTGENPAIPYHIEKGGPLIVVLGDNASGKSFLGRIIHGVCGLKKIECLRVGMELRTSPGIARAFVYGDESYQSTGDISAKSVTNGILTCQKRENPHVIIWDEPDLGLSDNSAAGLGIVIQEFAKALPKNTIAAVVTTHSKPLVLKLKDANPTYIHVGVTKPRTVEEWLSAPIKPILPEALKAASRKRYKRIQAVIEESKK